MMTFYRIIKTRCGNSGLLEEKTTIRLKKEIFSMFNHNTKKQNNKIFSENGRIIGWSEKDAICKRVNASKHMLRTPRGWAWDVFVLERANCDGFNKSIIYEMENDLVYQANLEDFWRHGVPINRGYGEQICLPLKYWQVSDKNAPIAQQLALPI